ncbi:MAG TPA: RDD family protein [Thermomonas sp.]|nr:RDD family protein [Thermomonas sp.]
MTDDINLQQESLATAAVSEPRPWPRYFARVIDSVLFGAVAMFVLALTLAFTTEKGAERLVGATEGVGGLLVSNMLMYLLALLPIGCLLALAQTPGKWLFGIRVRNRDGSRMRLWKALKREAWVLVRGVGLGFPVVTLFTHIASYTDLKEEGLTAWDRSLGCSVQHAPATWLWWIRATLGGLLVLAVTVWGYIDYFLAIGRS